MIGGWPSPAEVEYWKIANSVVVDRRSLEGLHHAALVRLVSDITGDLTLSLEAHVLSEPSSEVTRDVTVAVATRPRWMPRWLWRKVPLRLVTYSVTAEARWMYPHATEVLSLGVAHPYLTSRQRDYGPALMDAAEAMAHYREQARSRDVTRSQHTEGRG